MAPVVKSGFLKRLGEIVGSWVEKQKELKRLAEGGTAKPILTAEEQAANIESARKVPTNFFDAPERERIAPILQKANVVASGVQRQIGKAGGQLSDDAAAMLGKHIGPERVKLIQENKLYENPTLLKREVRKGMVARDRQRLIGDLEAELVGYYSPEQLKSITAQQLGIRKKFAADADASIKEEYHFLRNYRDAAVKPIIEKSGLHSKYGDIEEILNKTTTIRSKVSAFAELAAQAGLRTVEQQAIKFSNFFKHAEPMSDKFSNLDSRLIKMSEELFAKHFAGNKDMGDRFVSDYIENILRDGGLKARPLTVRDGMAIGSIEVNDKVMSDFATKWGITLTEDMANDVAKFVNQQQNVNRAYMRAVKMMDDGRYSEVAEYIPNSLDEVPWREIVDKTGQYGNRVVGDWGIGYINRVLTPEYAKKMKQENFGDLSIAGATEEVEKAYVNSVMARKNDLRSWEDGKWLGVTESLRHQAVTGKAMMLKRLATNELRALNESVAIMGPAARMPMPSLENINQNFRDIFTFRKNADSGLVETIAFMTDLNKKLFISHPFAVTVNGFQLALYNATIPPATLIKAYVSNVGNLIRFATMKHADALKAVVNQETQSEMVRYCRQNFFRNYYPQAAEKARLHVDIPKGNPAFNLLREVGDYMTFFFESADMFTRLLAADGTAMAVEAAMKKHAAKKLTSPNNYVADMSRELSMGVLDYTDRKTLVNMMLGDDRRFAAEYTNTVIDKVLFNYGKLNRPQFADMAKKNRITADAAAFFSFPWYSKALAEGVIRSAVEGDWKPAGRMAGSLAVFLTAAQAASNSDEPLISSWGKYASNSALGLYTLPLNVSNRPALGVVNASLNQLTFPLWQGLNAVNESFDINSGIIKYGAMENMQNLKGGTIPRLWKLYKDTEEHAALK